jgi:hypothetical protein
MDKYEDQPSAYALQAIDFPVVEPLRNLMPQGILGYLSDTDLLNNLGEMVKARYTTGLVVVSDQSETTLRLNGTATFNIIATIDGVQGVISDIFANEGQKDPGRDTAAQVVTTCQENLRERGANSAIIPVGHEDDSTRELVAGLGYRRDDMHVVVSRNMATQTVVDLAIVALDDPDDYAIQDVPTDLEKHEEIKRMAFGVANRVQAGDRVRCEEYYQANRGAVISLGTVGLLCSGREAWLDVRGDPVMMRGGISRFDAWAREQRAGSINALVAAGSGLLRLYNQLGFVEQPASLYRKRLEKAT